MPDDVPEGWIEQTLFDVGHIGAKYVEGYGVVLLPATTQLYNFYGYPQIWLPTDLRYIPQPESDQFLKPSDTPSLYLGYSIKERIEYYAEILKQSLISLRQNVVGLRQPLAINGRPGNSAEGELFKMELEEGELYIPLMDIGNAPGNVIDLKAHDYTQPLINVYNAMDNEILTMIGVQNTGTEKASGLSPEEATSIHQELTLVSDVGIKKRKKWCKDINPVLNVDWNVEISEAYLKKKAENFFMEDDYNESDILPGSQ